MAGISKRTYLRDLNPHLICPLCRGYLIDATTVVECLHSYCRSCILKHLRKDAQCPSCKHFLNTAKPNIKADKALQDIVYKLVPGLYHREMRRRREFYSKHPEHGYAASLNHLSGAESATPEQRGEDVSGRLMFTPEDAISLSLEYLPPGADPLILLANDNETELTSDKQKGNLGTISRRYLQCPALVTIAHLKKFLGLKYSVDLTRYSIDICHKSAPLPEHWTLMDVACIFAWKRNAPIRFFYRITQEEQRLEAPPNDRPSTPGVGATQPATSESNADPEAKLKDNKNEHATEKEECKVEDQPLETKPECPAEKIIESESKEPEKVEEMLVKRSTPSPKNSTKTEDTKVPLPLISRFEESAKQIKSPIKIMKNSEGRYQVLHGSGRNGTASPEFSVVSIGDGANSNGVKITLKQCSPNGGSATTNTASSTNSKKPKVLSNVLLKNSTDKASVNSIVEHMQDLQKQEKQKRKVTFMNVDSNMLIAPTKQPKKLAEPDKKQFLQSFRLTANKITGVQSTAKQSPEKTNNDSPTPAATPEHPKNTSELPDENKDSKINVESKEETIKSISTNIADRLSESKQLVSVNGNSSESSMNSTEQQPIDVYAFPNDSPTPTVPVGAVKRKCPPGLPIFDIRKKHQQYQTGKRARVNATKSNPVKNYKSQPAKSANYANLSANSTRVTQNVQTSNGSSNNTNITVTPSTLSNTSVNSTSPKNGSTSMPLISNDTRNLLDGCGLNIPASLSITLTAPKSPSRSADPTLESSGSKDAYGHAGLDKLNPSITLNDKSVDPRVLKALKSGQMRMPLPPTKNKPKQLVSDQQDSQAKRKKQEMPNQHPKNILDLSAAKKSEIQPLRIPTPQGKVKPKPPPVWSQGNCTKGIPSKKEDNSHLGGGGQVVTLTSGQRFYWAPPGSLTPAANRIGEMPSPSRAPVYAPCISSTGSGSRTTANLSSVFPSLQSLYALSQSSSLEQFHKDSRMRARSPNSKEEQLNKSQSGRSHIAAQCAPIKPARSAAGSFALPIVKNLGKPTSGAGAGASGNSSLTVEESHALTNSHPYSHLSDRKTESSKPEFEQNDNCASTSDEGNPQQDAASPRVTSTVSPSPPPVAGEATTPNSSKTVSGSEVTSTNKSPESPDSSSVVTENIGNAADCKKSAVKNTGVSSPTESPESKKSNTNQVNTAKANDKKDSPEFKKPMTSEALQKRFLAAFPSNEWANNPVAAEQFGNFLKSLQAEAHTKNIKPVQ